MVAPPPERCTEAVTPTRRRWPARSRTPSRARPASEPRPCARPIPRPTLQGRSLTWPLPRIIPADPNPSPTNPSIYPSAPPTGQRSSRPRVQPHPAPHALPGVLRDVPQRHPQHLDRRGDRLLRRPRRPAPQAAAGRAAPDQPPVAFFATGDSIVSNNLVLNLYKHINAPEARMYLCRQLFEEALHVQFYLTLLDTYIPDHDERTEAFAAIENIPSIRAKADFCFKWIDSINRLERAATPRRTASSSCSTSSASRPASRAVLLRRLRLRLLPALQGPAQRPGRRHQLGVPRRVAAT